MGPTIANNQKLYIYYVITITRGCSYITSSQYMNISWVSGQYFSQIFSHKIYNQPVKSSVGASVLVL